MINGQKALLKRNGNKICWPLNCKLTDWSKMKETVSWNAIYDCKSKEEYQRRRILFDCRQSVCNRIWSPNDIWYTDWISRDSSRSPHITYTNVRFFGSQSWRVLPLPSKPFVGSLGRQLCDNFVAKRKHWPHTASHSLTQPHIGPINFSFH